MTSEQENRDRSIELAKTGFENAQERITAIDAKVGVAIGFLVVLLPTPLVVAAWMFGLEGNNAENIFRAVSKSWFATIVTAGCLVGGMFFALLSLVSGFFSLVPRAPKGYEKCGPFHNEWKPSILFPIYQKAKEQDFCAHLKKLSSGIDQKFVIGEFDYQLQQLGRILSEKFRAMQLCFKFLCASMALYGVAFAFAAWILVRTILGGAPTQ